jgi:hypothetical protein
MEVRKRIRRIRQRFLVYETLFSKGDEIKLVVVDACTSVEVVGIIEV